MYLYNQNLKIFTVYTKSRSYISNKIATTIYYSIKYKILNNQIRIPII
ncbi:hypothetical protein EHRUM3_10550 [Ehrlichia ruminantium]|uniref:Uncharacterized protein n=1 Tax=Ehrlichia ruminantium TaxID=779 RepID=A0A170TF57_EHRRU|nr:hypothetical protein EHRUM3_10550 [Ehrlichia ruminantium]